MFQRIVAALDGSDSSLRAADAAVGLAVLLQARVDILSVEETSQYLSEVSGRDMAAHLATVNDFESFQAPLLQRARQNGVQARGMVVKGHVGQEILRYTREERCDLLVLGHQGHSGVWGTFLGSTAEKLVNFAPCSTLVIRSHLDKDLFSHLLVAFDGSPFSWQAFHVSLRLEKLLSASIHLLFVIEDSHPLVAGRDATTAPAYPATWNPGSMQEVVQQVLSASDRQWDDRRDEIVVYRGSASEIVTRVAREKGADMLVLGATGQEHPWSSTAGKTARNVANEAPCAVLIVRPLVAR